MIVVKDEGIFIEFDVEPVVATNALRKISLPLEIYLRLAREANSLEKLRVLVFDTMHEIREQEHRDRAAALGRSRARSAGE